MSNLHETDREPGEAIPSEAYTRAYYETNCGGYEEFNASKGRVIPRRLQIPLDLAQITPGMLVVDVGCGRGEVLLQSAARGARVWGLDYAWEAVKIARFDVMNAASEELKPKMGVQQATAFQLPFPTDAVDVVFMIDVVEHLTQAQLTGALGEIRRILKPGGRLVVHTAPNTWYYRFGYPFFRLVQRIRGLPQPPDPRDRWEFSHVHINEQNPILLHKNLSSSGYKTRVWLLTPHTYDYESSLLMRIGMRFLTHVYPFRWVFCNDLFAIGIKL
jgi:SAM-dependent methyltransferase